MSTEKGFRKRPFHHPNQPERKKNMMQRGERRPHRSFPVSHENSDDDSYESDDDIDAAVSDTASVAEGASGNSGGGGVKGNNRDGNKSNSKDYGKSSNKNNSNTPNNINSSAAASAGGSNLKKSSSAKSTMPSIEDEGDFPRSKIVKKQCFKKDVDDSDEEDDDDNDLKYSSSLFLPSNVVPKRSGGHRVISHVSVAVRIWLQ